MRRQLMRAFAILAALACAVPAISEGDTRGKGEILQLPSLGLEELFRLAELGNPELAAASSAALAGEGLARQAGLWRNPSLALDVEEMSTEDSDMRAEKLGFAWPLSISGHRGDLAEAARATSEASRHAYGQKRRETFLRVHELWASQLYYRAAIPLHDDFIAAARRTQEIAETRFAARAIPEAQVTRAQLELYEFETARRELERSRVREGAELSALVGGPTLNSERMGGSLADGVSRLDLNAMRAKLSEHPSYLASASGRDAAGASLRAARSERIPDLDLGFAYGKSRPTDDSFLEFSVSLPLPLFNRGQGKVAAERARVSQAEQEQRAIRSELELAFDAAIDRYLGAEEKLRALSGRIVPAAVRGLEQAQSGYGAGRLSFLELIEAQRTSADIRLRALELERELAIATAELMSLAGSGPYGN